MKHILHDDNQRAGAPSRYGHPALHGSATDPGMPNLAGAQMPGPGTRRLLRGEDGRLADAAAGPEDLVGHLATTSWFRRMLRGRQR